MSTNPYTNEPGFGKAHSEMDIENMSDYTAKVIFHPTNFAVCIF